MRGRPVAVLVLLALLAAGCSDPAASPGRAGDATSSLTGAPTEEPRTSIAAESVQPSTNTTDAFAVTMPTFLSFPSTGDDALRRMRLHFLSDWEWVLLAADDWGSDKLGFLLLEVGDVPEAGTSCGATTPPQYMIRNFAGDAFKGAPGVYEIWYWNEDAAGLRVEFVERGGASGQATGTVEPPANATDWRAASFAGPYDVDPTAPTGGSATGTLTTSGPSWIMVAAGHPVLSEGPQRAAVSGEAGVCAEEETSSPATIVAFTSAAVGAGTWTWDASYEGRRPPLPRLDDLTVAVVAVGPAPLDFA